VVRGFVYKPRRSMGEGERDRRGQKNAAEGKNGIVGKKKMGKE